MTLRERKGQSAIEYLTTYGWMLLVIAIVGGAIFTTVQGQTQNEGITGLQSSDVDVVNFGMNSDNNLSMEVRAEAQQPVTISAITLEDSDNDQATLVSSDEGNTIPVAETRSFEIENIDQSDSSQELSLKIEYESGELENLETDSTLTGNYDPTG